MFEVVVVTIIAATLLASCAAVGALWPGLYRDVHTIVVSLRLLRLVKRACRRQEMLVDRFEWIAGQHPDKTFIVYEGNVFNYKSVDSQANQVARVLTSLGMTTGDTLALVMTNEPAFIWIFLGALKIGARVAVVNHHLLAEGLRRSITCTSPRLVIVGDGLDGSLPCRVASLDPGLDVPGLYSYNTTPGLPCFSTLMDQTSGDPVSGNARSGVRLSDPAAFIFTSGTTGLPKPAIITHKKMIICSHSYSPSGFSPKEVLYLCLPLYHASALNLALLNVISAGATIVLKEKFSVSQFWQDCVRYEVTCFQYVGEMLRYLVNAPHREEERKHKVWAAIGNGLRADIWDDFKRRFQVKQVFEFYGSTEVPATVINLFNVPGSVGRLSPILSRLLNLILVKVDPDTLQPYRNKHGRCELIGPESQGVMIQKLTDKVKFDGYLGPASLTRDRILLDVLEPGDFYVNTNDVFYLDAEFNLFFKDRIGDSYRWKGENVSTADVSNAMNTLSFVQDTNVFGVKVPGYEGKAGMAAVNLKENEALDEVKLEQLSSICREKLPGYARPRFLRFQRQMSLTSTFKQQKTDLAKEGFDPIAVNEPLFYLDRTMDNFKPLDETAHKKIVRGEIAL